jgi:hypothetical protein
MWQKIRSRKMTEADNIRAMSDSELAEFIGTIADCWECPAQHQCKGPATEHTKCIKAVGKWLKQEHVENGEGND